MDKVFQKFLRRGVDLAPVGVARREDDTPYFCTPKGASIFGWAGVDGIHFCFIRGFGGMVFSVSPMNGAPDYVHPLAKDFSDFLRLLLACGDAAALEQAWMWDEARFDAFLRENPPTEEQRQVLSEVAEQFRLTPMERPWAYVKELQAGFDYGKIRYTEDYYDTDMEPAARPAAPKWKVYFDGNFWEHRGKDRAGKEIALGREFDWAGHRWVIPAAYSCGKGLVVDFCMRVEPEEIRAFMEKWSLDPGSEQAESFTREQRMRMELENPFCLHFCPRLESNGKTLRSSHGCSVCFNPRVPEGFTNELEAKWAVDHYGLDDSYGWVVCRNAFPWETRRRPEMKTLRLTMEQQPVRVPGPHFTTHQPGDTFAFSHPVSGTEYRLTVRELERKTLPAGAFGSDRWFYPTHTVAMTYTLSPEPEEDISVQDCAEGDRPLEIAPAEPAGPTAASAAVIGVIGVIGGADGPTAIVFGGKPEGRLHAAYSSPRFEPVEGDVEWRVEFRIRRFEEASFALI